MAKTCFQCKNKGKELFGYTICDSCKSKLGLLRDEAIKKHFSSGFKAEIERRLEFIEKEYIRKKIKLLHVKERMKHI